VPEATILEPDRDLRRRRTEWHAKWAEAQRLREQWTEADFEEEAERLQAEIEARIAAGDVTICDPARVWVGKPMRGVDDLSEGLRATRSARRAA
jgi:hypothetical protein